MDIPQEVWADACNEIAKGGSVLIVAHGAKAAHYPVGWCRQMLFIRPPVKSGLMSVRVGLVLAPEDTYEELSYLYEDAVAMARGKVIEY